MIISGNQPYFLPYIGYWQLIHNADVFLVGDDYNFIRKGWVSRNRLLNNGADELFNIQMNKASDSKLIQEIEILNSDHTKLLRKIKYLYHNAPFFSQGNALLKEILSYPGLNLADFLINSINVVCRYLEINTPIIRTSTLIGNCNLKKENRIYDQCKRFHADTFVNAIGGIELYDPNEFKKRGLTLKFLKTKPVEYKQFNHPFVPNLSILDVIMFNSREEVIKMLGSYELVESSEK